MSEKFKKFLKEYSHKMWKVAKRNFVCYFRYALLVVTYIVCYPAFSSYQITFVRNWIEPWNYDLLAVIIPVLFLILCGVRLWKMTRQSCTTSISFRGWIATALAIYCYHLFCTNDFVFKGWEFGHTTIPYLDILFVIAGVYFVTDCVSLFFRSYSIYKDVLESSNCLLLRDEAVSKEDHDRLGYGVKAKELVNQLYMVDVDKQSYSVGITGTWGVGKSSFINLMKPHISNRGGLIVDFHPRDAKDSSQIQEEFFRVFAHVVGAKHNGINHLVYKYAESLQTMDYVGWLFRLFVQHRELHVAEEKMQINNLLSSLGARVFVFVEDLDRLTRDELIEVLKVIDSNGDFCNTIFVTAYDKVYVNKVLTAKNVQQNAIYTDKYFQYECQLIKPSVDSRISYLNSELFQWGLCQASTSLQNRMKNEWPTISRILHSELTTLRHVKRFVSQFKMAYASQKDEVVFEDYCLVILVRYLDVNVYEAVCEHAFTEYKHSSNTTSLQLKKDYLEKSAKCRSIRNLTSILEYLFPAQGQHEPFIVFNRIRRSNSFYNYFYELRVGHLSFKELNHLFEVDDDKVLATLDALYRSGDERSVTEFLITRQSEWIGTPKRLRRYVSLLIAAHAYNPSSVDIWHSLSLLFLKEVFLDYQKAEIVNSLRSYGQLLFRVFKDLTPQYTQSIGMFFVNRLKMRMEDRTLEERFVESIEDCCLYAFSALKEYDKRIGTPEWNVYTSIQLADIFSENGIWYEKALSHVLTLMTQYPDLYVPGLFAFFDATNNTSNMRYRNGAWLKALFPNEWDFYRWILHVQDDRLRYICRVYFEWNSSMEEPKLMRLQIPLQQTDNMDSVYAELHRTYKNHGHERAIQCRYMDAICGVVDAVEITKKQRDTLLLEPAVIYDNPTSCKFLLMGLYPIGYDKEKMSDSKRSLATLKDKGHSLFWEQKRQLMGDFLPNTAYMDMFPISVKVQKDIEELPIEIRREILKVSHDEIVRLAPRIIIYANASTFYYWGKSANHPWMGYELEDITEKLASPKMSLPRTCRVYKITGLQNSDKCIIKPGMSNLIGTYIVQYGFEQYKKKADRLNDKHLALLVKNLGVLSS